MATETLVRSTRNGKLCNLQFKTHRGPAWIEAFYRHYEGRVTRKPIQDAVQLSIVNAEDPKKKHLTVNLYHTGKVMVQGAIPVLTTFENQTFDVLRGMVEQTALQI